MNDSKPGSPINEENLQQFGEALEKLGAHYRERYEAAARQAGREVGKMLGRFGRGVEWTVQS